MDTLFIGEYLRIDMPIPAEPSIRNTGCVTIRFSAQDVNVAEEAVRLETAYMEDVEGASPMGACSEGLRDYSDA